MKLPGELLDEFAKVTHDTQEKKENTIFYGTAKLTSDGDFVVIDGATTPTPAIYATNANNGDRVMGMIKNRKAVITANITNPAMTLGILKATTGIIVEGYLTTNAERIRYDDQTKTGLTFSAGGMGAYGGQGKYWYIKNNGEFRAEDAYIKGEIRASKGYIGSEKSGFKIDEYGIYSGDDKTSAKTGFITLGNTDFTRAIGGLNRELLRFAIGANFGVSANGVVYAHDADITGKITATSGKIGNFDINGAIYSNNKNAFNSSNSGVYLGDDGIALGAPTKGFTVTSEGVLTAKEATIDGVLTAKAGSSIGPWKVADSAIYKGTNSPEFNNADALYFGNSGLSIKQNFVVDANGSLTAKDGKIGNWTIGNAANELNGSLYTTGKTIGSNDSIFLIPLGVTGSKTFNGHAGTDWVLTCGKLFGVNKKGEIYCSTGKIGPLNITADKAYTGTSGGNGIEIGYGSVNGGSDNYYFKAKNVNYLAWLTPNYLWVGDTSDATSNETLLFNSNGLHVDTLSVLKNTTISKNLTVSGSSSLKSLTATTITGTSFTVSGHTNAIGTRITASNSSAITVGNPSSSVVGDEGRRAVASIWMPIGTWAVTCTVTVPKGSDETYAELNFRNTNQNTAKDSEYIVGKIGNMRVQLVRLMQITSAETYYFNLKTGTARTIAAGDADITAVRIA